MYDRNNLADVHIQQRVVSPLNNYLVSVLCHCYHQQQEQATTTRTTNNRTEQQQEC